MDYTFTNSNYFNNDKKRLVEKHNLTKFYDVIYLNKLNTTNECVIYENITFEKLIKCKNNHIICYDCYQLLLDRKNAVYVEFNIS